LTLNFELLVDGSNNRTDSRITGRTFSIAITIADIIQHKNVSICGRRYWRKLKEHRLCVAQVGVFTELLQLSFGTSEKLLHL
jgi:hypothetical protein